METKIKDDFFGKLLGKQGLLQPLFVDPTNTDPTRKTFPTIYSAINNIQRGGVIKIMPGVYRQNIQIKIGNIKIQANQPNSNVIIINSLYPSIKINLDDDKQMVHFQSIKFAHSCNVQQGLIQNLKQYNYCDDQVNLYQTEENMNTIIYIKNGKVSIEQCKFSLNVINISNRSIVPSIVIEQNGCLNMGRCQIYGTKDINQQTIGILSKNGNVIIKQSNFYNHRRCGIYLSGNKDSLIKIENCKIKECGNGITLIGDFKGIVQNNIIEKCQRIGIKIGMCNRSKISANNISKNGLGIQFVNSDPQILNNQIEFNKFQGILSIAKQLIKSEGQIKFNVIKQNKQAGIRCTGNSNQAKILCNSMIGLNKKCGILVQNNAQPHIFRNFIHKNLGQGILIKQGSSAFIQKNQISHNLKSNIALGGKNSINTIIIQNKIHSSRCQGIFVIHGAKFLITQNQIYNNHEGIVMVSSITRIQENIIRYNQTNGILLVKDCKVQIFRNKIQKNNAAGIFIRDYSHGRIEKNQLIENKYELVIQKYNVTLKDIATDNKYIGQIRIPQNYYNCTLI